ncbi:uncharacterized protein Dmoj_GI26946 [Drosophila mojavensis]|uniref:Uncharacterized protein n=1 Tax=Drosophila mojavensis TaxID=7230 RepID=A0A0Q9X7P4_DROMO|nr:uncharacterized protein Dmoj_GI26946 [Drosophila mojavensis]
MCYGCRKVPAPPRFFISNAAYRYAMREKQRERERHARNGLNDPPCCKPACGCCGCNGCC